MCLCLGFQHVMWRVCTHFLFFYARTALGDFEEPKRSTLTMFGVLTSAVRIYQDRWGYGIYSGPIGTAVLMITVKWVRERKEHLQMLLMSSEI